MGNFGFRSVSDVNRDYLLFEFVDGNDDILFDIGMSNSKQIEIAFGPIITGKIFSLSQFSNWLREGTKLVMADAAETDALR